jgi:hypothetical protein
MESALIIVTVVSLGLAVGMSALAWRLLQEERRRSAARAAALHAMATGGLDDVPAIRILAPAAGEPREWEDEDDQPRAWDRRLGEDRAARRSVAPHDPAAALQAPNPLFAATVVPRPGGGRWLAAAAVALAFGAAAAYRLQGADLTSAVGLTRLRSAPTSESAAHPLELLSLRHSVDADGSFTVTGFVRNPRDGETLRKVVAVVYLFDAQGSYFAGGRAPLDSAALQPGEESPFVVRVAAPATVGRYRVGFRSEGGEVVAHADRRGQLPIAATGGALNPQDNRVSTIDAAPARQSEGRP